MTEFLERLIDLFGASRYSAKAVCMASDQLLLNLYFTANSAIILSGAVIAILLMWHGFQTERFIRFLYFRPAAQMLLGVLFAGLVMTYVTSTLTLLYGVYYLDILARFATAGVSVATAWMVLVSFRTPPNPARSV